MRWPPAGFGARPLGAGKGEFGAKFMNLEQEASWKGAPRGPASVVNDATEAVFSPSEISPPIHPTVGPWGTTSLVQPTLWVASFFLFGAKVARTAFSFKLEPS